jgi:TonB family protein
METILLLMNLTQLVSGELTGNDFNRDNFGFIASYETTADCNDALIKLISTDPENPDNWTIVFKGGSAAATSDEFAILTCVPKLRDVNNALALSRAKQNADSTETSDVPISEIDEILSKLQAEADSNQDVSSTLDKMTTRITNAWKRPIDYQGGFEVYLRMSLLPDGSLEKVEVARPSGSIHFDKSAIEAVTNASPFSEIQQFDVSVFEEKFKSLTVKFRPED